MYDQRSCRCTIIAIPTINTIGRIEKDTIVVGTIQEEESRGRVARKLRVVKI